MPLYNPSSGATPGGADTQVQFNDGGALGGDAGLAYNKTNDRLTTVGGITFSTGPTVSIFGSNTRLDVFNNGATDWVDVGLRGVIGRVNGVFGWSASTPDGGNDTGLARNAASVVEVNNGTAGQSGVLLLRGRAFAALPATPIAGMHATVTDSSTATWGATITGGGANVVHAFYNGTNWVVD